MPLLVPGALRPFMPIAPRVTAEDKKLIQNIVKAINFLSGDKDMLQESSRVENMLVVNPRVLQSTVTSVNPNLVRELLPFVPSMTSDILPKITAKLLNRITARAVREVFVDEV